MDRRAFLIAFAIGWFAIGAHAQEARGRAALPDADSRIDINHASVDQLVKLPGMTRVWALRIIRFRPYRMKTDLMDRGVVTNGVYERIRDYVIAHREAQ